MAIIALVNPSIRREDLLGPASYDDPSHMLPPIGLLTIAAALRSDGHDVYIIDAPGEKVPDGKGGQRLMTNAEIAQRIKVRGADYVGITSTVISIDSANKLAHLLRESIRKDLPIIYGGHQISAVFSRKDPREKRRGGGFFWNGMQKMSGERRRRLLARFDGMSYGIIGEGERPMTELIRRLENGQDPRGIPGLVFPYNGSYQLAETPANFVSIENLLGISNRDLPARDLDSFGTGKGWLMPAYDLLVDPINTYKPSAITYRTLPSISIITSRGCPQKCKFCDMSTHEHIFRKHSPDYLIDMLKWLEETWGYRDFYITDDQGTADPHFMFDFCNALEKAGKGGGYDKGGYHFSIIGRVHPLNPEGLKRMGENGLHQIAFGLESAVPEILEFFDKRTGPERMINGVRIAHEAGLEVKGLFMAGSPGETTGTLARTQTFINDLKIEYISNSALTPIPGSELYEMATEDLMPVRCEGSHFQGNELGIWLEDPDDWPAMNLWDCIWVPKTLSDELGSPLKAKEYIEHFVRRKNLKSSDGDPQKTEIDWGNHHQKVTVADEKNSEVRAI